MRKKQIAKLTAELAAIDRNRMKASSAVDIDTLTEAEQAFLVLSDQRGKLAYRDGWPDFLVVDADTGGTVGVEVKRDADPIRPSQCIMFAALEAAGLRVLVWNPKRPSLLTPWHVYSSVDTPRRPRIRPRGGPRLPAPKRPRHVSEPTRIPRSSRLDYE